MSKERKAVKDVIRQQIFDVVAKETSRGMSEIITPWIVGGLIGNDFIAVELKNISFTYVDNDNMTFSAKVLVVLPDQGSAKGWKTYKWQMKGSKYKGVISSDSRYERIANRVAAALREGDVCRVDMARVQKVWPQQLRIIKDVVRQGGGRVVIEEVRGDTAQVSAFNNPVSRMVGMVDVPIDALQVVKGASRDMQGSAKDDQWAEILQLIKKGNHVGEEMLVNFIAQVWNGGMTQWIINGYAEEMSTVVAVASKLGSVGRDVAQRLKDLRDEVDEYEEAQQPSQRWDRDPDEEIDSSKLDKFDEWFYRGIDDKLVEAFWVHLKG